MQIAENGKLSPCTPRIWAAQKLLVEFRWLGFARLVGPIERKLLCGACQHVYKFWVGHRRPRFLAARWESIGWSRPEILGMYKTSSTSKEIVSRASGLGHNNHARIKPLNPHARARMGEARLFALHRLKLHIRTSVRGLTEGLGRFQSATGKYGWKDSQKLWV